jgi:hypothetical protein
MRVRVVGLSDILVAHPAGNVGDRVPRDSRADAGVWIDRWGRVARLGPSRYTPRMRTRFQSGRIRGYQPTLIQFNDLLELSQRGIDSPDAVAELLYRQGLTNSKSGKGIAKVAAEHLSKLTEESGESKRLINLKFSAGQESPARSVKINIDPDGWTYYEVESSDFTWALGRFHELTEMLLANRRLPAKARYPLPEVLTSKQNYIKWGSPLWTSLYDPSVRLVRWFKDFPFWLPFFVILSILKVPPSSFSLLRGISFVSFILAYAAAAFWYGHRLNDACMSYVSISRPRFSIVSFINDKEARPVDRGILIFTIITAAISMLTLIADVLR